MNRKKLRKLQDRIATLRTKIGNISSRELMSLASSLGRKRDKRGKEPTFVSIELPDARPISIPIHPGTLNRFTAGNILDQLEQDLDILREKYDREGE